MKTVGKLLLSVRCAVEQPRENLHATEAHQPDEVRGQCERSTW